MVWLVRFGKLVIVYMAIRALAIALAVIFLIVVLGPLIRVH